MQTSRNGFEAVSATFKRLTKMRRIIPRTKPDRVITLYPQINVLSILAMRGTGIPVYVSEHNDPNLCANGKSGKRCVLGFIAGRRRWSA